MAVGLGGRRPRARGAVVILVRGVLVLVERGWLEILLVVALLALWFVTWDRGLTGVTFIPDALRRKRIDRRS